MADLNDLIEDSNAKLSRRNVVVGTAWAVPAIMAVGAAPAFAASNTPLAITGQPLPTIFSGNVTSYTISGTGPTGKVVAVTAALGLGSVSVTATPNPVGAAGTWSATFNLSSLEQGTVTFTASVTSPADNATATALKDTSLPNVTVSTLGAENNHKKGTLSGGMGNAAGDAATVTITLSPATIAAGIALTGTTQYTGGTPPTGWNRTWTGPNGPTAFGVTVTQVGSHGNVGTVTYNGTT